MIINYKRKRNVKNKTYIFHDDFELEIKALQ